MYCKKQEMFALRERLCSPRVLLFWFMCWVPNVVCVSGFIVYSLLLLRFSQEFIQLIKCYSGIKLVKILSAFVIEKNTKLAMYH